MKVFFRPLSYTKDVWHVLVSYGWEKDPTGRYLQVMRAQFFCEDVGQIHTSAERFRIETFDREKHIKNLCPNCVLKIKNSKKYGPIIKKDKPASGMDSYTPDGDRILPYK